jgi:hypothetical protein
MILKSVQNSHRDIVAFVNGSGVHYYSITIGAMQNERRSASAPLLLVPQLSIRTNAMPLFEVRTPLPPLPNSGEVITRDNIISIPFLSDEELDALKYSRIRKQAKRSI